MQIAPQSYYHQPRMLSPWLVSWQRVCRPKLRLFCFPYAGGNANIFRSWAEHLPQAIEVLAIQLPGRGCRFSEAPQSSLDVAVKQIGRALAPYLDQPYALFGHSLGALMAFEVARQLKRQGYQTPWQLVVSSCRAPQLSVRDRSIHNLPDNELIDAIRDYKGTPESLLVDHEMMALVLPILRADFKMVETYQYQSGPKLRCPLTVYGGRNDESVSLQHLLAWREQTTDIFTYHQFEGDHFYLHQYQAQLLKALGQLILSSLFSEQITEFLSPSA